MFYYLTKAGERPKIAGVSAAREGDLRPDRERVLDGHDGYVVAHTLSRLPGDFETVDEATGEFVPALTDATAAALQMLDAAQDAVEEDAVRGRRAAAIMKTWEEIQNLRRDSVAGTTPLLADTEGRWDRYPSLMALAEEFNVTLANAAASAENRLRGRVRRLARIEARAVRRRAAVRGAATVEEKLAAAEVVDWG